MHAYLYLAIAIVAEVIGTTALKAVDGFSRPWPLLTVVVGYGIAFWMLSRVMQSLPVGVTYAIWSGLGIVLIGLAGWLVYGQKPDAAALAGMALIIAGVLLIQLFSASAGH